MDANFRLWNPKAKAWALVQVRGTKAFNGMHHRIFVRREGSTHNGWHYDGQAEGSVFTDDPGSHIYVGVRDATNPLNQGWGLVLYLAAALTAGCLGRDGIFSSRSARSPYAARVWEAMKKHGLAYESPTQPWDLLDAKAVRALYKDVPDVKLTCP